MTALSVSNIRDYGARYVNFLKARRDVYISEKGRVCSLAEIGRRPCCCAPNITVINSDEKMAETKTPPKKDGVSKTERQAA